MILQHKHGSQDVQVRHAIAGQLNASTDRIRLRKLYRCSLLVTEAKLCNLK